MTFGAKLADSKEYKESFLAVRNMLLDTNLRYPHTENLRNYLHLFRRAPEGREDEFKRHRDVYYDIKHFLSLDEDGRPSPREEDWSLVREYRVSSERLSSLAAEIRKDKLWKFRDSEGRDPIQDPSGQNRQNVETIANLLARAISIYFRRDREKYLNHTRRLGGSE